MSAFNDYYELRLYRCASGRLPDLHHRMGYEIAPLFARHGIPRPLGYWESFASSESPLYAYLLQWPSLDQRMKAFSNFYADADWHSQRDASNAGGTMVDQIELMILRPSSAWDLNRCENTAPVPGLHELRMQLVNTRDAEAAHRAWGRRDLPFLRQRGAVVLGIFTVWFGAGMPQMISLLGWPDFETRQRAYDELERSPANAKARAEERTRYGGPLFDRCNVHLLRPAPYGIARAGLAPLE
ncbi:MAG: NIPSNAP family protein [Alphaproteobacteria bacterium]|nr:NIPSNAP family protein [Alphaproteobacteria bacterium]